MAAATATTTMIGARSAIADRGGDQTGPALVEHELLVGREGLGGHERREQRGAHERDHPADP